MKLLDQVIDPSTKTPSLIFEHVDHIEFRTLYPTLTKEDIKFFIREILTGL